MATKVKVNYSNFELKSLFLFLLFFGQCSNFYSCGHCVKNFFIKYYSLLLLSKIDHTQFLYKFINPIHAQILCQPIYGGGGSNLTPPPLSPVTAVIEVKTKKHLIKDLK